MDSVENVFGFGWMDADLPWGMPVHDAETRQYSCRTPNVVERFIGAAAVAAVVGMTSPSVAAAPAARSSPTTERASVTLGGGSSAGASMAVATPAGSANPEWTAFLGEAANVLGRSFAGTLSVLWESVQVELPGLPHPSAGVSDDVLEAIWKRDSLTLTVTVLGDDALEWFFCDDAGSILEEGEGTPAEQLQKIVSRLRRMYG